MSTNPLVPCWHVRGEGGRVVIRMSHLSDKGVTKASHLRLLDLWQGLAEPGKYNTTNQDDSLSTEEIMF